MEKHLSFPSETPQGHMLTVHFLLSSRISLFYDVLGADWPLLAVSKDQQQKENFFVRQIISSLIRNVEHLLVHYVA